MAKKKTEVKEEKIVLDIEGIEKMDKELKKYSATISRAEARYLVDTYYQVQEFRKATGNQIRSAGETGEPTLMLDWTYRNMVAMENQIKAALEIYSENNPVGKWMQGITGIGPVISAGLLAHIDIEKAPTAGHIWSFAGLDPNTVWLGTEKSRKLIDDVLDGEKKITDEHVIRIANRANINNIGRLYALKNDKGNYSKKDLVSEVAKRPWNAALKVICWKVGQSFVKVSNKEEDFYGKIYKQRKEYEIEKNEAGHYAGQAASILKSKNIGKTTDAYKSYIEGKLPPAHIQQRAERYAAKIFLSHLQEFWYEEHYGEKPPKPFAIGVLGHAHQIPRPE